MYSYMRVQFFLRYTQIINELWRMNSYQPVAWAAGEQLYCQQHVQLRGIFPGFFPLPLWRGQARSRGRSFPGCFPGVGREQTLDPTIVRTGVSLGLSL